MISSHLINSPDHRLRKGYGMHLDLAVISLQIAICSLLGLPWLVAATVRSVAHLRSLTDDRRDAIRSCTHATCPYSHTHHALPAAGLRAPLLAAAEPGASPPCAPRRSRSARA